MRLTVLTACAVLLLAACGTSPEPDYFSLDTVPGEPLSGIAAVVKVQRPILAGYLDRPDFVRQENEYRLLIDNTDNWAEPLDTMAARILAADLQQRLPSSTILTEDNATPPDVRFAIDMNIERFNKIAGGQALLQGELIIKDKTTPEKSYPIPVQITAEAGEAPQAVAESLSRLIADTADMIAGAIVHISDTRN